MEEKKAETQPTNVPFKPTDCVIPEGFCFCHECATKGQYEWCTEPDKKTIINLAGCPFGKVRFH